MAEVKVLIVNRGGRDLSAEQARKPADWTPDETTPGDHVLMWSTPMRSWKKRDGAWKPEVITHPTPKSRPEGRL